MTARLLTTPFRVTNQDGLMEVEDLLHDETLDFDGIEYFSSTRMIALPVRRQFHDGPERIIGSGLLWKTYEKEWMHSLVTIRKVRSWRSEKDQGIGTYTFCSLRSLDSQILIECNEALVLSFDIEAIDVEVVDLGFKGKARIKRGPMGIESSSSSLHY